MIHESFFSGRKPLDFDFNNLDHPMNVEWYNEQIDRCINGYSKNGYRMTGDHYWFVNFCPISISILDINGNPTDKFKTEYPFWTNIDDYVFKQLEEAQLNKKFVMFFSGRGFGKTYMFNSIGLKKYVLQPESWNIFSSSTPDHSNATFSKVIQTLNALEENHPTLKHKRITNKQGEFIKSGEIINYGTHTQEEGYRSVLEKITYDKVEVTDGRRVDFQLWDEVGSWENKPSLADCIAKSDGTWKIGSIVRAFVIYTGTGGSVKSKQAKDIYFNPEAYNLYHVIEHGKKCSIFIPAYKKLGGFYEKTGINDDDAAKKYLEEQRKLKISDPASYQGFVQAFPFTPEEVFTVAGSNQFNQDLIARQYVAVALRKTAPKPIKGFLEWEYISENKNIVKGVKFYPNEKGDVEVIEEPYFGENNTPIKDLYIIGIDSIDMGNEDTTTPIEKLSKFALYVKKRMYSLNTTDNVYVCKYVGRPDKIQYAYELSLKISVWYHDAKINLEFTRKDIIGWFKQKMQDHRFLKRSNLLSSNKSTLIGTPATVEAITLMDGYIKQYIDDYYDRIFYESLLTQLRDYRTNDRGSFDEVVAMGLCELGSKDLDQRNIHPEDEQEGYDFSQLKSFGKYIDANGVTRWGVIPELQQPHIITNNPPVDYIDATDLNNIKIITKNE